MSFLLFHDNLIKISINGLKSILEKIHFFQELVQFHDNLIRKSTIIDTNYQTKTL